MKILFNGLLYSKQGAGISNYAKNLMNKYDKLNRKDIELVLNEVSKNEFENLGKIVVKGITSSTKRILTEQFKLNKKYKEYKLIHFPDYAIPLFGKFKKVATVHDLAFITAKEHYTKKQILTKKFFFEQTIKKADRLICISEFTYKELKRYYPDVEDEKIRIIYNGFNKPKVDSVDINLNKFEIDEEFIMFVGTIAPSKNLIRLLEAFSNALIVKPNLKFVIVGKKAWGFNEIEKKINELKIEKKVKVTGYVTDNELENLYDKCLFVVYPSLYEGFGLPALEALSRKKALLLSEIDIFKEIVGEGGAVFCNPYSVEDMSKKLISLIEDKVLRDKIIEVGYKRSEDFSWEKCAEETLEVYDELVRSEK